MRSSAGIAREHLAVVEAAELAGVGHLADHGVRELPAAADLGDVVEPLGADDGDHPLLALGDHHLPRLHALLAQRDAVEVDVDAGLAGHLRQRRGEPGRAAVLQRLDQPALDQLAGRLDQLLAGERVADLDGRPLLARLPSPSSWLASTLAPPMPSRPVVAP